MRIQARIFLVVSILILALVGVQVWLHVRQMRAVEEALGQVATSVGRGLLTSTLEVGPISELIEGDAAALDVKIEGGVHAKPKVTVEVTEEGPEGRRQKVRRIIRREFEGPQVTSRNIDEEIEVLASGDGETTEGEPGVWVQESAQGETASVQTQVFYIELADHESTGGHMLVITDDLGEEAEIEIPTSPTMDVFRATLKRSLAASAVLLGLGLVASAVVARRLAKPLQKLAAQSEALAEGGFGTRVEVSASGEVGELEAAFDRMSVRLEQLEKERNAWRRREHLAQLGDLSRGLAHTIRNPLHTLGLAVEELAGEGDDPRVRTARKQIARIDRWIRSFLALGAEGEASPTRFDLAELVRECLLEVSADGVEVRVDMPEDPVEVEAVASALRAAVGNLLENALQAAPRGSVVDFKLRREREDAVVTIRDRGPGIPHSVRRRLFEPHQTTRPGGAGMGLYLSRQLIEEMHGGELRLDDADGGGTRAVVKLAAGAPS